MSSNSMNELQNTLTSVGDSGEKWGERGGGGGGCEGENVDACVGEKELPAGTVFENEDK